MKLRGRSHKQETLARPPVRDVYNHYAETPAVNKPGWVKVSCIYHKDDTPSASLNSAWGWFHCFSCGFSGDSYKMIMEKEDMDFVSAVDFAKENLGYDGGKVPQKSRRKQRTHLSILKR